MKPVPKVAAATIGGAVVTVIVALGVELSPEVAAALATLVAFAFGWIKKA